MKNLKSFLLIILIVTITGCAGRLRYTQTGETYPARPVNSNFQILTTYPNQKFEEIGIIDIEANIRDTASFKEFIQEKVCQVGGDAVIASINGYGMYIKGTVIKYISD